ncbi:helix-turn-helix transcriptional regulator [Nocardioides nitrophenolicus]|uniref:helix-turn-helix transcriptional regulator n=1 Tax=Nocardioides nitrophenolicus TaxID=60489 RepID=UPI00195C6BA4|nr:WYL domain-containing protein [Nocardioides nitrophenolicus]MBM7520037.1 biotin operon repressor [Nocardioides nitrophenolicus]
MTGTSARMLALLSLLQTRREWPGRVLAERLEVSARTLRRDVDRLRELGYQVTAVMGPDGGYRLDAGSELPPLLFDDDQAVALAVALRATPVSGADLTEAAERALATMRQVLPSRLRHRVDRTDFHSVPAPDPVDPAVLDAVTDAVRRREVLRFDHAGHPRRAEPHHVVARRGRWYLVAWDLDRADWRVFRLDRVRPRTPNGPRFAPRELPAPDVGTFVAARFKGSTGPDAWPCTGEAVLACPATEVAPYLLDGAVEDLGPDRCRVRAGAWSWVGLAALLTRFDADLVDVRPVELRDAFGVLAERFARVVRPSRPGGP